MIATDALFSYRYAVEVIKERFELGEKAISTDPAYSFAYTRNVLKGTFVIKKGLCPFLMSILLVSN